MNPLDRKLLRDLWRMKGQATAIALVIAVGVSLLVMMTGLVNSLDETRKAYYERYRLADVFVPAKRAPDRLLQRLADISSVTAVEGRVTGSALIELEGLDVPVRAQALSLPYYGEPVLNDIYLTAGRRLDTSRTSEIILLRSFALAHSLQPGDSLAVTMNGARRTLDIVGLAQSPEFLYTTAPGEVVPDDSRFAVFWMSRTALGAAYDMEGAFNEALIKIGHGANEAAVIAAADRLLGAYGGLGAYGLEDQASNRFIVEEIAGMRGSSRGVPPVFLGVAAFLLYIAVSRIVQSEREQIGLIKAFGYSDFEAGWHYFKLVLAIAMGGALLGCLMGIGLGRAMVGMYQPYFKFPFLVFELDPASFVIGTGVSVLTASAGGLFVLRQVFALTPAVAMRPPAPPDYSRSLDFGASLKRLLDQPTRMVLRRIQRQPLRMAGAAIGVAAGMALPVAMLSVMEGFDYAMEVNFAVIDRSDAMVTLVQPSAARVTHEIASIEGVIEVEAVRFVPVILRHGLNDYRTSVIALDDEPRLNRAVDVSLQPIEMPHQGIVLSKGVADLLEIGSGDSLVVEVREGRRPTFEVPVAGIAEVLLGSPTYMDLDVLNRALREGNRVSAFFLQIDEAKSGEVYRTLKDMPMVAGVSLKGDTRSALKKVMDEGAGQVRYVMAAIAAIITFGVVYNSARIALSERSRDMSSLRVIGFTRGETAYVLLGELAIVVLLALPLGGLFGYYLIGLIAEGFSTEIYQVPALFAPQAYGLAVLTVVASAIVSGWLVKRDLDRADLVAALKTRD